MSNELSLRSYRAEEFDQACSIRNLESEASRERFKKGFLASGSWGDHYLHLAIDLDGELVGGRVGSREMEDSESPDWIVMMADQCRYLMGLLDNQDSSGKLRQIAAMRLDGWSVNRIAEALGCTRRTVGIRLGLIQVIWRYYLDQQV